MKARVWLLLIAIVAAAVVGYMDGQRRFKNTKQPTNVAH